MNLNSILYSIRRGTIDSAAWLMDNIGLVDAYGYVRNKLAKSKVICLLYHSIGPSYVSLSPHAFEKQMEYLSQKYQILSLEEIGEHLGSKKPLPPKGVVITFDDGYRDNYLNAFPILAKYRIPATIFLATGFIGEKGVMVFRDPRGDVPLPMLSWEEIKEMSESELIAFGAHTHTHPDLTKLKIKEAEREISCSKKIIEDELQKSVKTFAYPYGYFNEEIANLMERQGFLCSVTCEPEFIGAETHPYEIGRVSFVDNFHRFKMAICGFYSVLLKIFKPFSRK